MTLATLSKLKRRWGVAIKAMVVKLQQLHRIDADHARSMYKQISARGRNKYEPEEVGNERAIWLQKAISQRFSDGADGVAQVVSRTGLHETYFDSWTSWESAPDATIIPFNSQLNRRSGGPPINRHRDVTEL